MPAYTLPRNAQHINVLRMVVRESFSRDMADMLIHDVHQALHALRAGGRDGHPRKRVHC